MTKTIRRILPRKLLIPCLTRVAAYARVSNGKDAMLHSMSAQVSYYSSLIQQNPEWTYVGVYCDEAVTGTKGNRDGFLRMVEDCREGKIDMIITKSISRFARNTVTLLQTIRELKDLGIDVYFEEQNIHTMSGDGELMLTILASYAQEESLSVSENCKWRIRENFRKGIPCATRLNGYSVVKGKIDVIPNEADVIKLIFNYYQAGMGKNAITRALNDQGIPAKFGGIWYDSVIERIIQNEKYQGDLLLQKQYRIDHLTKKDRPNRGELPQYYVPDNHEAIIPRTVFEEVQQEVQRRSHQYPCYADRRIKSPFSGKLTCAKCGKGFKRRINHALPAWQCRTYLTRGKKYCFSKQIREDVLMDTCCTVLGMETFDQEVFLKRVKAIDVYDENKLVFQFQDGTTQEHVWKDPTRSDSWTPQMKEIAAGCGRKRWAHE